MKIADIAHVALILLLSTLGLAQMPPVVGGHPACVTSPARVRLQGWALDTIVVAKVIPRPDEASYKKGKVLIYFRIDSEGRLINTFVVSGSRRLGLVAIGAVKQWTFRPNLLNGIPVETESAIEMTFTKQQVEASGYKTWPKKWPTASSRLSYDAPTSQLSQAPKQGCGS